MINFGAYDLLAIDPGNTQSGYVRIRDGEILQSGVLPNTWMLAAVDGFFWGCGDITKVHDLGESSFNSPELVRSKLDSVTRVVAIEQIRNMGMIVGQEVFDTVFFTGRLYQHCADGWNNEPWLIPRIKIKTHLCGSAKAKDANIRSVLIDRWGAPGTKKERGGTYGVKSHAWSALAVATYCIDNPQEPKT